MDIKNDNLDESDMFHNVMFLNFQNGVHGSIILFVWIRFSALWSFFIYQLIQTSFLFVNDICFSHLYAAKTNPVIYKHFCIKHKDGNDFLGSNPNVRLSSDWLNYKY